MQRVFWNAVFLMLLMVPSAVYAQEKNEVGLVVGATETPSVALQQGGSVRHNSSLTLGAEYDRYLAGRKVTLSAGLDLFVSPADVKASLPPANVSPQYAYLFLTPHVRVKFNNDRTLQPWLLFGGGYADFAPAESRAGGVTVKGQGNSGALEFGGGVDTKPLLYVKGIPVATRFEVRDFYSGQPKYGVPTEGSFQNNVIFTGGLVLHF